MNEQENGETPTPRVGPLNTVRDVAKELGRLYRAARRGELTPGNAAKLAYILGHQRAALETGDLERRVEELEQIGGRR